MRWARRNKWTCRAYVCALYSLLGCATSLTVHEASGQEAVSAFRPTYDPVLAHPKGIHVRCISKLSDGERIFLSIEPTLFDLRRDSRQEHNGGGVRFLSGEDRNKDGEVAGEATCSISGFNDEKGRWFRFRLSGIAQDDFSVDQGELYLKAEFFKDGGTN